MRRPSVGESGEHHQLKIPSILRIYLATSPAGKVIYQHRRFPNSSRTSDRQTATQQGGRRQFVSLIPGTEFPFQRTISHMLPLFFFNIQNLNISICWKSCVRVRVSYLASRCRCGSRSAPLGTSSSSGRAPSFRSPPRRRSPDR